MAKITPLRKKIILLATLFLVFSFPIVLESAYYSYPSSYYSTYCSEDTTKPFSHWELSSYKDAKKEGVADYVIYYLEDQVNITLKASDDIDAASSECCVSGIDKIYYRIWKWSDEDSKWHNLFDWKSYPGGWINFCQIGKDYEVGCDGKYEFEYYSVDKAGNSEKIEWMDFYVDSSADYTGIDRETCDQRDGCYNKSWPGTKFCSQDDYPGNCSYFDFEASGNQCGHQEVVTDNDGDGWDTECDCDCDDSNPDINPGAAEICNDNVDNDCDGLTDCADPDCAGSVGPNRKTCCQSFSDCEGNRSSCKCIDNECHACKEDEVCKSGVCILNKAPNEPSNPSPSNGAQGINPPVVLSVDVSDPNNDDMDVSFYNDVKNSLIGADNDVNSGSRASKNWGLVRSDCEFDNGFYNCKWHVKACDPYGACTSSSQWSFQLCNFSGEQCSTDNQCCSGYCVGGYCSDCNLNKTGNYTLDYQCVLGSNTTHHLSNGDLNIVSGGSITMMAGSTLEFDSGHKILLSGDAYIIKSETSTKIKKISQ